MKFYTILILSLFLISCASVPLKKLSISTPQELKVDLIAGNLNVEAYKTFSDIRVYSLKDKKKLTEKKVEMSEFSLNRQSLLVNERSEAHFKYWVTDLKGDVDLSNMGLPPKGKTLLEVINNKAEVLAVKDYPQETIFYLPKISLPKKAVKPGDSWKFSRIWRSLKTGWPFQIDLDLKLVSWVDCGGLKCAHIKFTGAVSLPSSTPLKDTKLESKIVGEFVYAPNGHQFIWTIAESEESFITKTKHVKVKSCTASYQMSPDKEARVFKRKLNKACY